jgi:hypothetical protein
MEPCHTRRKTSSDSLTASRSRFIITLRAPLLAMSWTACFCIGVRSASVLESTSTMLHVYFIPFTCASLIVSLQMVWTQHLHQWRLRECIKQGTVLGIMSFVMLWGPLVVLRDYCLPGYPIPQTSLSSVCPHWQDWLTILLNGATMGAFIGIACATVANACRGSLG